MSWPPHLIFYRSSYIVACYYFSDMRNYTTYASNSHKNIVMEYLNLFVKGFSEYFNIWDFFLQVAAVPLLKLMLTFFAMKDSQDLISNS